MYLHSLQARTVLPAASLTTAAVATAGTELLYSVSWQAYSVSSSRSATSKHQMRLQAREAAWTVGCTQHCRFAVNQSALLGDAAFAAAHLQFAQKAVAQLAPRSAVQLHTVAAVLSKPSGAGVSASAAVQRQQQLLGLLKVAAQDAGELNWAHISTQPQHPVTDGHLTTPFSDAFGPSLAAGVYLAPCLLPAAPTAAPSSPATGAASGAFIVTGGLGALGLLIAAQRLSVGSDGSAHVVLLGRSVDLVALDAGLGCTWQRASSNALLFQLTVSKCDSSAEADLAGLAHSLHSIGMHVGTIVHAAGVLRVSAGRWDQQAG